MKVFIVQLFDKAVADSKHNVARKTLTVDRVDVFFTPIPHSACVIRESCI